MRIRSPYPIDRGHTVYGMPARQAGMVALAGLSLLFAMVALMSGAVGMALLWILVASGFVALAIVRVDHLDLEKWLLRRWRAKRRPRRFVYHTPSQPGTRVVASTAPASRRAVLASRPASRRPVLASRPASATAPASRTKMATVRLSPVLGVGAVLCAAVAIVGFWQAQPLGQIGAALLSAVRQGFVV